MELEGEMQLPEANSSTSKFCLELASEIGKTGLEEVREKRRLAWAQGERVGQTAVGQARASS